jgi:alkanesulfonate monooxygenase SsuD/methylene tetrahydromethanopterin reductase-like flavin-dependent oxidoreductase (luciferase family)
MGEQLRFGVYVPQLAFEYSDLLERARRCEELGFDSFWCFDHLYGPELPATPAFEGWTLATALLAQTTRLRVGHMVLCATFRHPVLLGKMAATLDAISGGRLNLGIGSGSYEPEHDRAGIPWGSFAQRSEILGETLEILTSMFANELTTFAGEHFQVHDLPSLPPPVQQPRPPVYVGGAGERRTLPLVARYADVWNVPTYALGEIERKAAVLEAQCARIGRDPATIRRSLEAVMVLAPDDAALDEARAKGERRFGGQGWGLHEGGYVGTPNAIVDRIGEHAAMGITEFIFFLHDRAAPATLELLANEVLSQVG